jgi:hypothetical protein
MAIVGWHNPTATGHRPRESGKSPWNCVQSHITRFTDQSASSRSRIARMASAAKVVRNLYRDPVSLMQLSAALAAVAPVRAGKG